MKQSLKKKKLQDKPMNKLEGKSRIAIVPLKKIRPNPNQPRKYFDEADLAGAAATLKANGQLEEIKVTDWFGENDLMIIDGERRWRAAGRLKWENVEVKIYHVNPATAFIMSVAANFGRADMTEIEEAFALQECLKTMTPKEVADMCGHSMFWLYEKLKYLRLNEELSAKLMKREIQPALALHLASYPKDKQSALYAEFVNIFGNKKPTTQQTHREILRLSEELGIERMKTKKGKQAESYSVLLFRGVIRRAESLRNGLEELGDLNERQLRAIGGQPMIEMEQTLTNLKAQIDLMKERLDIAL